MRSKLLANIRAYGEGVALVTATAPGADVLPWDHTGRRVQAAHRFRWNRTAPDRWRSLHRAASQRARRRAGGRFRLVAREWEYQQRGMLHMHVVVGMATAGERHAAHLYVQALEDLRERYGFGFVDRGKKARGSRGRQLVVIPPQQAANYLAKYLAPIQGGKASVSETAMQPDVPGHVLYVARELTARTGITMRTLRLLRLAFVLVERGEVRGTVDEVWRLLCGLDVVVEPARGP